MPTDRVAVDIKVPNQTRYLCLIGHIGENIARALKHYHGDKEKLAYDLNLVLTEAMANAIRHANVEDPSKEVHIEITIADRQLIMRVYDHGQGFDISQFAVPRHPMEEHGRGVYIIHTVMDEVEYRPSNNGHVLEMVKNL
jgi:serine/threonine-protein kinase RsbW